MNKLDVFEFVDYKFNSVILSYISLNPVDTDSHQFYHTNNGEEIIVFLKKNKVVQILSLRRIKASYHEAEESVYLYDFRFNINGDTTVVLDVYKFSLGVFSSVLFKSSQLLKKNNGVQVLNYLAGTPLSISLEIYSLSCKSFIRLFDKNDLTLMFDVIGVIDRNNKLNFVTDFLKILYSENKQSFSSDFINYLELKILMMINEIVSDQLQADRFVHYFVQDPELFFYLLKFRSKIYIHRTGAETLFEKIQINILGHELEKNIKVNDHAALYTMSNGEVYSVIIVQDIHKIDEEFFYHLNLIDSLILESSLSQRLRVDIIFKESFSSADEVMQKINTTCKRLAPYVNEVSHNLHTGEFYLYTYHEDEDVFKEDTLHQLPLVVKRICELHLYRDFDINCERNYFISAIGKSRNGKIQDERFIGHSFLKTKFFSLGSDSHYIDDLDFEVKLERMLKDLEGLLKVKNAVFNRLVFIALFPLDSNEHDISVFIKKIISKYLFKLVELKVEKIIFKWRRNQVDCLIEFKDLLDYSINSSPVNDCGSSKERKINHASQNELRELEVLSKNGVWAYRIPSFFSKVADSFCEHELGSKVINQKAQFIELDIDQSEARIMKKTGTLDYNAGKLIPVRRSFGQNTAGVVIGLKIDDIGLGAPLERLLIIGDLSHHSKGAIRAQECIRINAAILYAAEKKIPIDWCTASFGVQIHKERGVEGLDAAASTIREIVMHCHHGGVQINLIVDEINIGAQSYWNAMASILHCTSGILIMTSRGSMALTGPKSLTCALYSNVGSEDIDGFSKKLYPKGIYSLSSHQYVHGSNADSMIQAANLEEALSILTLHHYYAYKQPHQRLSSRRNVLLQQAECSEAFMKEIQNLLTGARSNREIILEYLRDPLSPHPLRFWSDARGVQNQSLENGDLSQVATTIVQEMLIGGCPTLVIFTPTGPLTPMDANIISRSLYKASGRMQVLIIGSLSGFSADPLSMKNHQLVEGAQIAKAIVEHLGPILIVNLGSLVGGTFVVFNKQLNQNLRILAVEGARVQVIGGKSAAKVVFHTMITKKALKQAELQLKKPVNTAVDGVDTIQRISQEKIVNIDESYKENLKKTVAELENKEGELFDRFHNARRACKVGSIDQVISADQLRESIIANFDILRKPYD